MSRRAGPLAGLAVAMSAVALAACGGDDAPPPPEPDLATVKRLALATGPLDSCKRGIRETVREPTTGNPVPVEPESQVIQCGDLGSLVEYNVYKDEDTRDKAIQEGAFAYGESPFFLNGRLVVLVVDPARSPLADRIKRECGCGEVRGKPFTAPDPTPTPSLGGE